MEAYYRVHQYDMYNSLFNMEGNRRLYLRLGETSGYSLISLSWPVETGVV